MLSIAVLKLYVTGQFCYSGAIQVKGDEFWDYDQQVDLEAFTAGEFYSILAKQSRDMTAAISRQKDQVRH